MKIYLSSMKVNDLIKLSEINPAYKPNVLLTYYGLNDPEQFTKVHRDKINSLILDCGAYSLVKKGFKGAVYKEAAEQLFAGFKGYASVTQDDYDMLFSMDDRFDHESFDHNIDRLIDLEDNGVRVVPVVHNLDNHEIDYYLNRGHKTIAIGQCKKQNRKDLEVLFNAVEKIYSKDGVKTHILGMTSPNLIMHVPAYSCDSTSWEKYAERGKILYWNSKEPKLDKTHTLYVPKYEKTKYKKGEYGLATYEYRSDFYEHINAKLGYVEDDFFVDGFVEPRIMANILYFLELEELITKEHEKLDVIFD